jgi:integrase
MKAAIEHRVPLSGRAVEILEELAKHRHSDFVFPGQRRNQSIGKTSLQTLCPGDDSTPHGFRSSFRDWCGEESAFPREIAEKALAHATGNMVERAYRRGDALEKRRASMSAWVQFLEPVSGNVIAFGSMHKA